MSNFKEITKGGEKKKEKKDMKLGWKLRSFLL
jgi:hypothetical protein